MTTPLHACEGIWQPVYAELDGEEAPKMALDKMEFALLAGRYSMKFGGEVSDQGTYAVHEATITLHGSEGPNAGRTIPSIFKLTDGMLSICFGLSGVRPPRFSTAEGEGRYLVNYQRKPV